MFFFFGKHRVAEEPRLWWIQLCSWERFAITLSCSSILRSESQSNCALNKQMKASIIYEVTVVLWNQISWQRQIFIVRRLQNWFSLNKQPCLDQIHNQFCASLCAINVFSTIYSTWTFLSSHKASLCFLSNTAAITSLTLCSTCALLNWKPQVWCLWVFSFFVPPRNLWLSI